MIKLTKNLIFLAIIIAGIIIGGAIVYTNQKSPGALSAQEAGEEAINFINQNMLQEGLTASLIDVVEENGLYKLKVKIQEQEFDSYVTLDGELFFVEGIKIKEEEAGQGEVSTEGRHVKGAMDAPVTITEYSDFQCPYCSRFHEAIKQVMADYQGKVKWVYKHFPLDQLHPFARKAAEASECAAEQNKFWEYADGLYAQQSKINPSFLQELAGEIGLNVDEFNGCLDSGRNASKVEADYQEGIKDGVKGTPGSFINGKQLPGAVPYEQLKAEIDDLL